jgi:anaphase-promoting complex subunit 3
LDLQQEAIAAFSRLEAEQYGSGWVLCCIGRAYYEMVDYLQAARVFEWARQADPTRLQVRSGLLFYLHVDNILRPIILWLLM